MTMTRLPELLAPAGTPDALRAAVAAGVDAVYAGLGAYNARAGNAGFSLAQLASSCALAHAHGVRVYVTLNACLHEGELVGAVDLAARAHAAGADAFIVADPGLALELRRAVPAAELHLSTQAGVQDAAAARLAARELGVSRVTCARELSLEELAALAAAGVEVEAFCHGAICICYSGACSFSAVRCGRSAMRGDCAQPCRMAYALEDASGRVLAGVRPDEPDSRLRRQAAGDRLLCPRDYLSVGHVGELAAAGVAALKIEGRMKAPDYVYNVVRAYRAALDAVGAGCEPGARVLTEQLARSFNRGFTDGYLRGRTGSGLMSRERAINQGLCVGEVIERGHEWARIAFERAVEAGDMLEIRSTPAADAARDVPTRWPQVECPQDVPAGSAVRLRCKRKVEVGSAVHVVRGVRAVEESARAIAALRDEEARLSGGEAGQEVSAPSHRRRKRAMAAALDAGAGSAVAGFTAPADELRPGSRARVCAAPAGAAAGARDDGGTAACGARVGAPDAGTRVAGVAVHADTAARAGGSHVLSAAAEGAGAAASACGTRRPPLPGLRLVGSPDEAQRVLDAGRMPEVRGSADCAGEAAAVALGAELTDAPSAGEVAVAASHVFATPCVPAVPCTPAVFAHRLLEADADAWEPLVPALTVVLDEVARAASAARVEALCRRAAAVVCRNLSQIEVARAAGAAWEAAPPIPVWNVRTVRWLAALGARRVWLPYELAADEVRAIAAAVPEVAVAPLVQLEPQAQLMVTEHCLLTAEGPCARSAAEAAADATAAEPRAAADAPRSSCRACPRRLASQAGDRVLVDADGARLPVRVDALGRTRIFDTAV